MASTVRQTRSKSLFMTGPTTATTIPGRSRGATSSGIRRNPSELSANSWRLGETVKAAFAAQVEFPAHRRRGSTERVVEMVDSQRGVFAVVAQDDGGSITSGDIDAASRADGRGKDEISNTFESERFATRFASRGFKPGQNVLIVAQEIEGVAVEQWRGHVRRHPI